MLERRRHRLAALPAAALPLLLAACGGPRLAPADAAARVGDEIIPYAEFEAYVSSQVGLDTASSSRVLSGLLDQYLDEVLLRRLAVDEGRAGADTAAWEVVDALLASRRPAPVSDEEIAAFYRAHADRFARPERVLLNQVLAEDSEIAGRVAERMAAGDELSTLASRFGDGVTVNQSELTREDLPVAFADRIFSLAAGEVSEVIEADYGYHVFQVIARRPAEASSLAEARPLIADILGRQGRRRSLERLVGEARGRYNVEVFVRNLPFNYEGQYDSPNS